MRDALAGRLPLLRDATGLSAAAAPSQLARAKPEHVLGSRDTGVTREAQVDMPIDTLGGQIRPQSFRDEDNSPKRGKIWLCALVTVLVVSLAILWYVCWLQRCC